MRRAIPKTPGADRKIARDRKSILAKAEIRRLTSELMAVANQFIEERQHTQVTAAIVFGVTQPRISDLSRGRIEHFSLVSLIEMLVRVGAHVELHVTHKKRPLAAADIKSPARQTPSPLPAP